MAETSSGREAKRGMGVLEWGRAGKLILPAALLLLPVASHAAGDIGQVASQVEGQIPAVLDLLGGASYLGGAAFGVKGLLHLKEHVEEPHKHTLAGAGGKLLAASCLFALPSLADTAKSTIFGGSVGASNPRTLPVDFGS